MKRSDRTTSESAPITENSLSYNVMFEIYLEKWCWMIIQWWIWPAHPLRLEKCTPWANFFHKFKSLCLKMILEPYSRVCRVNLEISSSSSQKRGLKSNFKNLSIQLGWKYLARALLSEGKNMKHVSMSCLFPPIGASWPLNCDCYDILKIRRNHIAIRDYNSCLNESIKFD